MLTTPKIGNDSCKSALFHTCMLIFSFHACLGDAGLKTGAHFPISVSFPAVSINCLHSSLSRALILHSSHNPSLSLYTTPPSRPSSYSVYLFAVTPTSSTHWACVRCSVLTMQVFNSSSNAAGFQGRFSGRSLPGPFRSTNGRFHIRFTTDPLQQLRGWCATFSYGQCLCPVLKGNTQ